MLILFRKIKVKSYGRILIKARMKNASIIYVLLSCFTLIKTKPRVFISYVFQCNLDIRNILNDKSMDIHVRKNIKICLEIYPER